MLSSTSHARYRPGIDWRTIRTDRFTIYYPRGYEDFARNVLARSDDVHDGVSSLFGIEPPHCPIILHPDTDLFNGYYEPMPNRISLYETPYNSLRGFGPVSDMLDQVFIHEYAHFAHLTARGGWYGGLTRFIGDGLAVSNGYAPGWLVEGVTTWAETALTDGGRGRCSYFSGQFGSFTETPGLWNLGALSSPSPYHPPDDRIYSAGYFMTDYLARTYGNDVPGRIMHDQARHPLGGTRRAIKRITGRTPEQVYRDFKRDTVARFSDMREQAAAVGLPSPQVLLAGEFDRYHQFVWIDEHTIRALRTGYDNDTALVTVDARTGEVSDVHSTGRLDLLGPIQSAMDGRLVFARYFLHPLGGGDIAVTDLATFDPATGKRERVTNNEHVFSASLSPDGRRFVAARRNGNGIDLVLVNADNGAVTSLIAQPDVYWEAPVWSPDGKHIAVVRKTGQNADIVLVEPDTGAVSPLFTSDVAEDNEPSFSPDGRWIVFSSNRTGTWDIFAWDRTEQRLFRLTAESWAATSPKVSPDGSMLAFASTQGGLERLCVVPFQPEHETAVSEGTEQKAIAQVSEPVLPPLPADNGIPLWEAYRPFVHAPWASFDDDGPMLGMKFIGADPVGINSYQATVLYGLHSKRPGYDITVQNRSFWPVVSLRLYDRTDEGNTLSGNDDVWYRERGGVLEAFLPIIHRTSPDVLRSSIRAGAMVRSFKGVDGIYIAPSRDRSVSYFGELTVTRTPDHAPRDLVPGWGQAVSVFHEEAVSGFGGELPGRNTVIQVWQYVPSPVIHHGFVARAVLQRQDGQLSYNQDISIPRGYDSSDIRPWRRNILRMSLDYQFPLKYMDTGIGMTAAHIYLLKGSIFADSGAGWHDRFDAEKWREQAQTSVGGILGVNGTLMTWLLSEAGVMYGYRLVDKSAFTELVLQMHW